MKKIKIINEFKGEVIIFSILVLDIVFLMLVNTNSSAMLYEVNQKLSFLEDAERISLYNETLRQIAKYNGVAFSSGTYCVYTKNRSYCDVMSLDPSLECIEETAFHELVHQYITFGNMKYSGESSYDHFCKREDNKNE